jgi:hypothetical protein
MADWVAADDDQYVAIAPGAMADRLGTIRTELSSRIERRCSPAEYTRTVAEVLRRAPKLARADQR